MTSSTGSVEAHRRRPPNGSACGPSEAPEESAAEPRRRARASGGPREH